MMTNNDKITKILIKRIRLGWHKPKLQVHLTNVTAKVNENENSRSQITVYSGTYWHILPRYISQTFKMFLRVFFCLQIDHQESQVSEYALLIFC